jgi:hypothetical protein
MTLCEDTILDIEEYNLEFGISVIVFNSISAVAATLLNVLVILAIWKTPSLQTPSSILLCNLALTELLRGTVGQSTSIMYYVSALMKWCGPFRTLYIVASSLGYGLTSITVLTLIAIAVDRLLAILKKTSYKSIVTKKRLLNMIIFVWIVPGTSLEHYAISNKTMEIVYKY